MAWSEEVWIRFASFAAVFALLAIGEAALPRRARTQPRGKRWATNLAIVALDNMVVRGMAALSVPLAAVAAAEYAASHEIGLFNAIAWPAMLEMTIAMVLLDLAIWAQHVASHKIELFWRVHQVHHADRDIDVSTALRFHPIEIALSMVWKIAVVLLLGASVVAVIAFEVLLNASAMFSHANLRLSPALDRVLRAVFVTPDMHRVHHSTIRREHDSNYGFNLSVWDRLFGTYAAEPEKGHENMEIGLAGYRTEAPAQLKWTLLLPFGKAKNDTP